MSQYPPYDDRSGPYCANCGYALKGLHVDGNCPECGIPILRSVGGDTRPNGYATATLVLGILSIVLGCGLGTICAILALIFFNSARQRVADGYAPASTMGLAKAGRICAWIGVAFTVLGVLYMILVVGLLGAGLTLGP